MLKSPVGFQSGLFCFKGLSKLVIVYGCQIAPKTALRLAPVTDANSTG